MARGPKGCNRSLTRLSANLVAAKKEDSRKKAYLASEKMDWENAICSVCLEFPHNAVLLLCSSHDKGCRPYMCATSNRLSNCLEQFKKAYTKEESDHHQPTEDNTSHVVALRRWLVCGKSKVMELACPLCRGQVKGWTVVEPARKYLNRKRRSCMQDNCSFRGTYKKLRKHVRSEHASAKPRKVDPVLEKKWKMLEYEREREDVMSTIRSSMPSSVVFGDYVIDMSDDGFSSDDDLFSDEEDDFEIGRPSRSRRGRGIPHRVLRAFIRETARRARLGRLDGVSDVWEEDGGRYRHTAGSASDLPINILSEEEDDYPGHGDVSRAGSMVRHRRRHRSRIRSRP